MSEKVECAMCRRYHPRGGRHLAPPTNGRLLTPEQLAEWEAANPPEEVD